MTNHTSKTSSTLLSAVHGKYLIKFNPMDENNEIKEDHGKATKEGKYKQS